VMERVKAAFRGTIVFVLEYPLLMIDAWTPKVSHSCAHIVHVFLPYHVIHLLRQASFGILLLMVTYSVNMCAKLMILWFIGIPTFFQSLMVNWGPGLFELFQNCQSYITTMDVHLLWNQSL